MLKILDADKIRRINEIERERLSLDSYYWARSFSRSHRAERVASALAQHDFGPYAKQMRGLAEAIIGSELPVEITPKPGLVLFGRDQLMLVFMAGSEMFWTLNTAGKVAYHFGTKTCDKLATEEQVEEYLKETGIAYLDDLNGENDALCYSPERVHRNV